jgi:hypothetical protein
MPRQADREKREEDTLNRVPWQVRLVQNTQLPPKESLSANAFLPSTITTPMAEMATIEKAWVMMIEHQIAKAKIYKSTLPIDKQVAYQEKIDAFEDTHYEINEKGEREFILLSTELRNQIYMHSLSITGAHHDDVQDMGKTIIESMGIKEEPQ